MNGNGGFLVRHRKNWETPFKQEQSVDVLYKGHWVGRKVIDLLVDDRLAVELESMRLVSGANKARAIAQSKATEKTSMLINFRNVCDNAAMEPKSGTQETVRLRHPLNP